MTPEERAESAYALTMAITGSTDAAKRVRNLVQQEIVLAIAEEREACAVKEREACAQLLDQYSHAENKHCGIQGCCGAMFDDLAAAIRARVTA